MKTHKRNFDLRSCRLNQKDLENLILLICSDISSNKSQNQLRINLRSKYFDISEKSLDDFLKHDNLPESTDNLSFSINSIDYERSVYMYFRSRGCSCSINGENESWVIGKSEQIKMFINTKLSKFSFLFSSTTYLITFFVLNSITACLFLIPSSVNFYMFNVVKSITVLQFFLLPLFVYLFAVQINPSLIHPYSKITLIKNKHPHIINKDFIVQLLLLLIGFATFIFGVWSYFHKN